MLVGGISKMAIKRRSVKSEPWHVAAAREVGKIDGRLSGANHTSAIPSWLSKGSRATFEGSGLARLVLPDGATRRTHVFTMQGSRDNVEFKGSVATLPHFQNWVGIAHDILRRHAPKK